MTLSRRSVVSGVVALTAASVVPDNILADRLTAEERQLMALVPPHVGPDGRAIILDILRGPDPVLRSALVKILHLSPPQQLAVLHWLELTEETLR